MKILFLILLAISILVYAFFQWIDGYFRRSIEKDEDSEILRDVIEGGKEKELVQHFLMTKEEELVKLVGWTNATRLRSAKDVLEKYENIYKVLKNGIIKTTISTFKTQPTYAVDCLNAYTDAMFEDFQELQNLKDTVSDSVKEYCKFLEESSEEERNRTLGETLLGIRRVEEDGYMVYEYAILKKRDD